MNQERISAPPDGIEMDPAPLSRALMSDIEELMSVGEYIRALADIVRADILEQTPQADRLQWRQSMTLLNLLDTQVEIVVRTAERVQLARMDMLLANWAAK